MYVIKRPTIDGNFFRSSTSRYFYLFICFNIKRFNLGWLCFNEGFGPADLQKRGFGWGTRTHTC